MPTLEQRLQHHQATEASRRLAGEPSQGRLPPGLSAEEQAQAEAILAAEDERLASYVRRHPEAVQAARQYLRQRES
jgi:hypothetical protein